MDLKDISKQSWTVVKDLKIKYSDMAGYDSLEQECHLNNIRDNGDGLEVVNICCNHQPRITELAKSDFFTVEEVVVSKHERHKDFILEVIGNLELSGLTIRKKKHDFSEEEKQRRSDAAKHNFHKKEV